MNIIEKRMKSAEASRRWRDKHPTYVKDWCDAHKERRAKMAHERYLKDKERINKRNNEWIKNTPWWVSYRGAKNRCLNTKDPAYESYGGRGIKFLMTVEDFKYLWFRDKAYEMEVPTVDRLDSDGNYELSNCEYVELQENGFRAQMKVNKERMS